MALNQDASTRENGWIPVPTADTTASSIDDAVVPLLVDDENLVQVPVAESSSSSSTTIPTATSCTIQIHVVAPATLPEGYEFDTLVNGRTIKVQVPVGGIEEGQTFSVAMSPEALAAFTTSNWTTSTSNSTGSPSSSSISVPIGRWRDDIFDCFSYGCCHPHCWMSCLCPKIAAGQIIRRLQLTLLATPASTIGQSVNAFRILFIIQAIHFLVIVNSYIFLYVFYAILIKQLSDPKPTDTDPSYLLYVAHALQTPNWICIIIEIIVVCRIRKFVRTKYAIQGSNCDDCLLSVFCRCCSIAQMMRHTTDYNIYSSNFCTPTGLDPSAPSIV